MDKLELDADQNINGGIDMDQFNDVVQQVEALRQKLREVINHPNADTEIITSTNALDNELAHYAHALQEKRQAIMRSF